MIGSGERLEENRREEGSVVGRKAQLWFEKNSRVAMKGLGLDEECWDAMT